VAGVPDAELVAQLTVDSSRVPREVKQSLDAIGRDGDAQLKKTGKDMGDAIADGMGPELRHRGSDLAVELQNGLNSRRIHITGSTWEIDRDGNVVKRWIRTAARDAEHEALSPEVTGAFKKVGQAIGDAVGAGFNVSGRSPLIALLIPVVGEIALLIGGLIQGVQALIALLYIVPGLLGAIILQVGVLFLAFKGLGTAIQGAFAAKNADELQKAIEGLTPAAQEFVKSLLPLRELFKEFSAVAQEGFFKSFGDGISVFIKGIQSIGTGGISQIAEALGTLARSVVTFFNNPFFQKFVSELIPSTVKWIQTFTPALQTLLIGFAELGTTVMPFMNWFGEKFNAAVAGFGRWLSELKNDPEFLAWLERVKVTLGLLGDSISAIVGGIKDFVAELDKAGGNKFLEDITKQFEILSEFFKSELGAAALEGLIHTIQALGYAFLFLFLGIGAVFALLESTAEFVRYWLIPAFAEFFQFVWSMIVLVNKVLFTFLKGLVEGIGAILKGIFEVISTIGMAIFSALTGEWNKAIEFIQSIPGKIGEALKGLWDAMYQAGAKIVDMLVEGIKSKFSWLGDAVDWAAKIVRDHWPFSPAKTGPLSGSGDPLIAGQKIIERVATGMDMEAPALADASSRAVSNISFGAGAIMVNFSGAPATQSQANMTGGAVASQVAKTIEERQIALAVRSMIWPV